MSLWELFVCAEQEHSTAKGVCVTHLKWDTSTWAHNHRHSFPAGPLMPGGPFTTEIGTPTQALTSSKGWGGQIEPIRLQITTTGPPGAPLTKPWVSVA